MNYSTVNDLQNNNTAKHEVLKQTSSASYPFLIKVTMADNSVYRFVKYYEDVTFDSELYKASDFTFTPPEEDTEGIKDATLSISDVEQFWTEKLRTATTFDKITVEFVAVIIYDGNNVMNVCEIESTLFNVKSVTGNGVTMDISLSFDERININVPCDVMDSVKCAGAS